MYFLQPAALLFPQNVVSTLAEIICTLTVSTEAASEVETTFIIRKISGLIMEGWSS
jgi:hypothetical protein